MIRLASLCSLCLVLVACATPTPPPVAEAPVIAPAPEPVPERPIPEASVYPLLLAEFALRRREYEVAIEYYLEQSRVLGDAGVSAYATQLAQFLQREPEALEAVQHWIEAQPDNLEANNTLAVLLSNRGRTPEALEHLAVIARAGEPTNFSMVVKGFAALSPADQASLVAGVNSLSEELPSNTQLMITQVLLHEELKQPELALAKLDDIFALDPYQSQAVFLEAKLLQERQSKAPFKRMEEALAHDPENDRLRLQYARLLTRDDMAGAREQFEILSAASPRDGDLLFSLALINRETGENLEARAYLRQMLDLGQRVDEAHYYLGRIEEEDGNPQKAIAHYTRVEDGRDFNSAHARVGRLLVAGGQIDKHHKYFQGLRLKHPSRKESLYAIEAEILSQAGQLEASLAVLNQALIDFPESSSLRYSRSMVGEQQNKLDLMERDLRAIIALEPDNATALNALGYSLANRTDRYDEAYELIARALELSPEEPAILDSMGWVLYRQGQYEQALEYLALAYQKFPDPEVAAHLGEVLWVSGSTSAAVDVWQGALLKDPDHEILNSTIKRLGVTALGAPQ